MSATEFHGVTPPMLRSYLAASGWQEQPRDNARTSRFFLPADHGLSIELFVPLGDDFPQGARLIRVALDTIADIEEETRRQATRRVLKAWVGRAQEKRTVPDLSCVTAAWHILPPGTRDRIGIIAVDMAFQAFVSGDAYDATGCPEDRAVLGDSKEAHAIRDAAKDAETSRLTELHWVIEAALPDLFGPEGENPAWSANPGPRP